MGPARQDARGAWSTIVGQDSVTGSSAFYLQYGGGGRWAFSYDGEPRAEYVVQPVLGDWYHVVGVRDAADQKLRLYVNGDLVGQSDVCGGTTPSGPLTIGRGQWSGNPVDYWAGTIDDVRVFDRALSDAEVAQVYAGDDGEEPALDVTVTAETRCLAGKAYVAVRATNGEDVPVDVTLATPFGTRAVTAVAPGRTRTSRSRCAPRPPRRARRPSPPRRRSTASRSARRSSRRTPRPPAADGRSAPPRGTDPGVVLARHGRGRPSPYVSSYPS